MASTGADSSRVIPAQISFLTIYNPSLGDTEETEQDQIVFWTSKDDLHGRRTSRSKARESPPVAQPGGEGEENKDAMKTTSKEELGERLRQIGLVRGMVEFAKDFTTDKPLDTIETDRSRIILHELEPDWWILASIDLTRLPATQNHNTSGATNFGTSKAGKTQQHEVQFEYSAREVSPGCLLRTQLEKAHNLFLIHHATSLWEMYNKLGREPFCALLGRYWEKFAGQWWDVLLHGNPVTDVYGDCVKLAGGGELGVGVGEEEWGSGEREVLEGFIERTEGCIDFLVGRYGNAPRDKSAKQNKKDKPGRKSGKHLAEESKHATDAEIWLGAGEDPGPADGLVFSGVGRLSRRSLATVSQWMEAIFKHGDSAYGVGDNPSARPRQKRKKPKFDRRITLSPPSKMTDDNSPDFHPQPKSSRHKAPDLRRQAMENNATPSGYSPGIPAPLVGAVERSLDKASARASNRSGSRSPKSSPAQERSQEEAMNNDSKSSGEGAGFFSVEGMKNVFSFGYGSSWTLNPGGFEKQDDEGKSGSNSERTMKKANDARENTNGSGDRSSLQNPSGGDQLNGAGQEMKTESNPPASQATVQRSISGSRPAEQRLQEIDPTPEVSDEDLPFVQRLEQSIGRFLIGLSGDLENMELNDTDDIVVQGGDGRRSHQPRLFVRTITVELANAHYRRPGLFQQDRKFSSVSRASKGSVDSGGSGQSHAGPEPKTSAAASVDGAQPLVRFEKMQVAVYVHQPFIFVFLFELHTPSLTMPSFYRSIHHQLGPLQKPLLHRTDPKRVADRIATALNEKGTAAMTAVKKHIGSGNVIYDFVYDPTKRTIRTSIPNIPMPSSTETLVQTSSTISGSWYTLGIPIGTSTSSSPTGLDVSAEKARAEPWTRVEALNVYTQMLNTFSATRNLNDLERTVKTGRGWWVLWMKVSAPGKEHEEQNEAFLVRKSADYTARSVKETRNSGAGRWLLRDQAREVSGSSISGSSATTGARGVSEGVGIDARKWIEGLLSLTQ